jgi:GH35 family endo-1,4-beta-xylanase
MTIAATQSCAPGEPLPAGTGALVDEAGTPLESELGDLLVGTVVVDDPAMRLADVALSQNIVFGSAVQSAANLAKPGPGGVGTLGEFIKFHSDVYVPGVAMLPQHIQYSHGVFDTSLLEAFLSKVQADGKSWRGHVLLYPAKDRPWVSSVVNSGNWQAEMDAHFEAIAEVPGVQTCINLDVVNELLSATTNDGYRHNTWYNAVSGDAPEYIAYAFQKARALWPQTPLYFCHDHTEQITDGYHTDHTTNILNCIEACLDRGAPIDGFNQQAHLTYRLGFNPTKLRDFLSDLRSLGLNIIIGELDARTGYQQGIQEDTPAPSAYASTAAYDAVGADLIRRYLDVALPFVAESGGQLLCWGLSDIDHSWMSSPNPPGERPLPWDSTYLAKPQYSAIRNALLEL